jgi:hypothetical protein
VGRRWKTLIAVGAAAIGLAVPAGALASLHVSFSIQAVGSGAWQQGRSFSFTEKLFFQHQKIGNDSVACRFFPRKNAEYCHAVFNLPKGSIFANGWVSANPSGPFRVPVSNGTKTYTNAKGTVRVTGTPRGDNYHFSFSI